MSAGGQLGNIRTSKQLFRDCLRLATHVAGKSSPKAIQMKKMIRVEFKKNKDEIDIVKIEAFKGAAVRALATYMLMVSSSKDEKFKKNADTFNRKERDSLETIDKTTPT